MTDQPKPSVHGPLCTDDLEWVERQAPVHIRGLLLQLNTALRAALAKVERLKAEKETWGNEFSAVVIMKQRIAEAEEALDAIANDSPISDDHQSNSYWRREIARLALAKLRGES